MEPVIKLKNITKIYELGTVKVHALRSIDLNIKKGDFVAIEGPSGSGKSTLLNLIGCIDTPTKGQIFISGTDVSVMPERELTKIRLRKIGFIFQLFYLIPTLNAQENIELPMREAKVPKHERKTRVTELLEMVGLLQRAKHYPNQLSGGEQQRIAIARALSNRPEILLADEPTGEIDRPTSKKILTIFKKLIDTTDLTIIMVTHDPKVAAEARRRITIEDGKIV
jgi:putative ABC transport system ATP-binding protein